MFWHADLPYSREETYVNPVYNVSRPLIKAKLTMKARNNECYISKIKTKHGRTGKAVHASGLEPYITIQTSV